MWGSLVIFGNEMGSARKNLENTAVGSIVERKSATYKLV